MSTLRYRHVPVVCLEYNKVYESIELAGKLTNCNPDCIRHVCKGRQASTKTLLCNKLHWMYAKDYADKYGLDALLELNSTSSDFY